MPNKIEGYIGCPDCGTVLFRLESVPATNPGVRMNQKIALSDADPDASHCPNEGCGVVLGRVAGP